jgi:hypothetical protein
VVLDLAIQAAGLISAPGSEGVPDLPPWDGDGEGKIPDRPAGSVVVGDRELGQEDLVAAPSPDSLVGSAVWVRPTVFCGNAAELTAFRQAVEQEKPPFWVRKKGRLPFGRLRTVLWTGEGPSDEERGFWEGRGVRARQLP